MPDLEKLNNVIDAYAATAYGSDDSDGGELERQRALAIDAYQGKNIEPAPNGRSQVVDWSVFETVQWILPSLTRIFANGDDVVEFEPTGPEDEQAAEQESAVLNHIITQKNNWFLTCLSWFQDALITKNAYCMAFMDERIVPEIEEYKGQSEEQVAYLLDDDVEVVAADVYEDPEYEPQPVVDPMTGQPVVDDFGNVVIQPAPQKVDIRIRRSKPVKKLCLKVLAPEHCLVDEDCDDFTLEDCDYFEFYDNITISELRSMGYDVPDDIGDDPEDDTVVDAARDEILGQQTWRDRRNIPDPTVRRVKARWIWVRHDYDEDGVAELRHVLRVGQDVLENEYASRIPVACIVPFLNTHRHVGNSVADLVFDIQRIKTALLRSGLDSLYLSTNPRHAVSERVNLEDMLVSRPGGIVRVEGTEPPQNHITPLPTEFVFPQAQEGLRHMDTVIESRVGVNRMFQGIDESNINDHNRVGQLSTMAAQRVEQIARIFANGVERLFSICHEVLIKSGHQSQTIRLRGEWVDFDPAQWKTGRDMRVVAPFAAGNKDALVQRLMIHMNVHREAAAAGHPMVQPDDTYNLANELAKATDLPGDRFYTDPATLPPQEPAPDYTMLALEVENKKADNDAREAEMDAEVKLREIETDAELDKYKADLQAETQLILAKLKAGESVNLEQVRAELRDKPVQMANESINATGDAVKELKRMVDESLKSIGDAVKELKTAADSPREIVRDERGRVVGVKVNGKVRKLQRDSNGKVTGI